MVFSLLFTAGQSAFAQATANINGLQVSSTLQKIYKASEKSRENYDSVVYYSEKMEQAAMQSGESNGKIIAAQMLMDYYFYNGTTENMEKAVDHVKEVSREVNDAQSYFAATVRLCEFYAKKHLFNAAFDYAQKNYNEAKAASEHYGLVNCYAAYGLLYAARNDMDDAKSYYQLALAEQPHVPGYNLTNVCEKLASLYEAGNDSALIYLDKGLAIAKSGYDSLALYKNQARQYAMKLDKENTERVIALYNEIAKRLPDGTNEVTANELNTYADIANKRWAGAEAGARKFAAFTDRLQLLAFIGKQSGNKLLQFEAESALYAYRDSIQKIASHVAMEEYKAQHLRDEMITNNHKSEMKTLWITGLAILVVCALLGIFVTVYIRKRQEAFNAEKERGNKLEHSNQSQKLFLQNMSHEIRTPLNAICGFSQIVCEPQMRELVTDEELVNYGTIINSNTELLLTLVNDILDISDMESGKYKVFIEPCSPNMVCKQAQSTVQYRCPNNVKMYFTTDIPDTMKIMSDARRLGQVLINFLTNAVKHTRQGEIHIHASISENPGKVTFSVTDTGDGVPPEMAEKIFKRFEKLENFKQGTGLGLSICRNIATALGGQVKLDTSYTEGARFVFLHPFDSM